MAASGKPTVTDLHARIVTRNDIQPSKELIECPCSGCAHECRRDNLKMHITKVHTDVVFLKANSVALKAARSGALPTGNILDMLPTSDAGREDGEPTRSRTR